MTNSLSPDTSSVLFEELPSVNGKHVAVATLNAEKAMNSLSLEMVRLLHPQLEAWAQDDSIVCVVLQGAGDKAFCAGGDVVQLYQGAKDRTAYPQTFFEEEYRLDYAIHTYPKPFLVWGNGVVMGGGLGLMSGASHRIVTENTYMAMPEVTIGLYPDVGGTWFLNHAPGKTGLFLGLTGAAINATDAIFVGLADSFISHEKRQSVIDALVAAPWSDNDGDHQTQVAEVLKAFEEASKAQLPAGQVEAHFEYIKQVTAGDDLSVIVEAVSGYQGDDKWLSKAAKGLTQGCPATVHLVWQQLQRGQGLSLRDVFQMELIMSVNCARIGNFQEGVRALLIDKDRNPTFIPPTLAEITDEFVQQHFEPPWGDETHPLENL